MKILLLTLSVLIFLGIGCDYLDPVKNTDLVNETPEMIEDEGNSEINLLINDTLQNRNHFIDLRNRNMI